MVHGAAVRTQLPFELEKFELALLFVLKNCFLFFSSSLGFQFKE